MKFPWLDGILLVVILLGAIFVWRSGNARAQMQTEFERLNALTGDLPIGDPTKIHVRALKTEDPLDFAWRIYLPPKYHLRVQDGTGSSSSGFTTEAVNEIVRVRLREIDGSLRVYRRFPHSSGLGGMSREVQELMDGRWDRLRVEQLGRDEIKVIDPAEEFFLLRLMLPEDLQKEAAGKWWPGLQKQFLPSLFDVRVGPPLGKN